MVKLNRLAGKLKEHGITQKTLATKLNLSTTTISNKMTGKIKFNVEEAYLIKNLLFMSEQEASDIFFCPEVE